MKLEDLISEHDSEVKAKIKKANEIKDVLGSYFEKEELEIGVVISVLMGMLVNVMKQSDTPPHIAIAIFATAVCKCYEEDEDDEDKEGVARWQN